MRYRATIAGARGTVELEQRARDLSGEIIRLAAKDSSPRLSGLAVRLASVVAQLLPAPDPVKECLEACKGALYARSGTSEKGMLAALRRYRELGCPELPSEPEFSDDGSVSE